MKPSAPSTQHSAPSTHHSALDADSITPAEWQRRFDAHFAAKAAEIQRLVDDAAGGPVICVETGQRFDSPVQAAEWLKWNSPQYTFVAKPRQIRAALDTGARVLGYHWTRPGQVFAGQRRSDCRPVLRLSDGQTFASAQAAANHLCCNRSSIVHALRHGNEFAGSRWVWADAANQESAA